MRKTATIALDIDGTLVEKHVPLAKRVIEYITSLQKQGFKLLFITGRTYHFAKKALHPFDFEYYLGVQNGAEILSMPDHKIYYQELMPRSVISCMQQAFDGVNGDFLIYAGYEKGDFCYFRPHNFSKNQLEYLEFLKSLTPVDWIALENFDNLMQDQVPLIKCLGSFDAMQLVKKRLNDISDLKVCLIDDRMSDFSVLLITHNNATKGKAILKLKELLAIQSPIIVAGDDMNDLSMFEVADISIAMQDGAEALKKQADIIAPPASKEGIIEGIEAALKTIS